MQRLAHQGEQDMWFTGTPKHSLFLPKESPSAADEYLQQSIEVPFDNPVVFGGSAISTLPRYGERVTDITVKMIMPQLDIPVSALGWVYPETGIAAPGIILYLSDGNVDPLKTNQTVVYYSTLNLQWLPTQTSNIVITAGPNNFNFSYPNTVTPCIYIGFRDFEASFFGFDIFNAIATVPIGAGELVYQFLPTAISPLTYEQSGWIKGYVPPPSSIPYVDSVGTFVIRTARLLIGGQTIDTVTGEYIELHQDVEVPYENQAALTLLTGKNDSSSIRTPRTYYTKLPFTRTMDIPVRDLSRHDVQIALEFDTFTNLTPATSQRTGVGFGASDNLIFFNYLTGDNSTGDAGITFDQISEPNYGPLTLNIESAIWDGNYLYIFAVVTILAFNEIIPHFIVFDTGKNIVTDTNTATLSPFPDIVKNECITSIGKVLYAVGQTGTVYTTTMRGQLPYTTLPFALTQSPLSVPLFTHTVTVALPATILTYYVAVDFDAQTSQTLPVLSQTVAVPISVQTNVTNVVVNFADTTGISAGLVVQFSENVSGTVLSVIAPYTVVVGFLVPTSVPAIPAGTSLDFYFPLSSVTLILNDATGVTPGMNVSTLGVFVPVLAVIPYGPVFAVVVGFTTPTAVPSLVIGTPIVFDVPVNTVTLTFNSVIGVGAGLISQFSQRVYGVVSSVDNINSTVTFTFTPAAYAVIPEIPIGREFNFIYPVTNYTLGTDGTNLYITSTLNDSYGGPQYNNVFVFNTTTRATSNLSNFSGGTDVNFSVQPVFDGKRMWYVDKYQQTQIYAYDTVSLTWTVYDYFALLGITQQNFSFSVFDGTYIYWFTDVSLTDSILGIPIVPADTDYWIRYNTKTNVWQGYNWAGVGGFYTVDMGLVGGDPATKEALFDGRYINLTSYTSNVNIRYDTTAPFTSNTSYTWYNYETGASSYGVLSSYVLPNPYGYGMTVGPMIYDGRYLYYLPYTSGTVTPYVNETSPAFILRLDTALPVNPDTFQGSLIVKYDKLPSGTKLPSEYVISQTSMSQSQTEIITLETASNGPVEEIFIVNQTPTSTTLAPAPYAYNTQALDIQLMFNNESTIDYTTWIIEPFTYHTTMPQRNVSLLTFSYDPESNEPMGTVNFSRIRDIQMIYPVTANSYTRVYTQSYNVFKVKDGLGGLLFNSPQWHNMSSIAGRWSVEYIAKFFIA